jgi:hypothetical protein
MASLFLRHQVECLPRGLRLGVIALSAPSNRLETLRPLMADVRAILPTIKAGQRMRVTA